ncbi:hypothetical protein Goshw_015171, partial [Gossypium schwendimanii]|nr:hypothetical protein [Gossypium schwendimanii]
MLEYEWGNPSSIMLSGEETAQEPDPNRQLFHHYATTTTTTHHQPYNETLLSHHNPTVFSHQNLFHNPNQAQPPQHPATLHSLYDPHSYSATSAYSTAHASLLSLDPVSAVGGSGGGYFLVPKTEEVSRPVDFTARIGLNLGGRTYFSSAEDDFVNRLYRRSRPGDLSSTNSPRCQAEGCNADLTQAKHYHRRHKVCEFHSKASTVIAAGLTQRFCQQCSSIWADSIFCQNSTMGSVAVERDWPTTIVAGENLNSSNPIPLKKTRSTSRLKVVAIPPLIIPKVTAGFWGPVMFFSNGGRFGAANFIGLFQAMTSQCSGLFIIIRHTFFLKW